ncbi:MAG: flavin-containing monooxygenase [Sandaracinaceae bacterium]
MKRTDVVVIGAGQAGLAASCCLSHRGIDHVVLDRGRVGERWRSERCDSRRRLTPNWMTRLPGYRYDGPDPDGFMTRREVVAFLDGYADQLEAPVEEHTTVWSVRRLGDDAFRVVTDRGELRARAVIVATGHSAEPSLPAFVDRVSPAIASLVPSCYRRPSDVPDGGVLVVGASATGVQLADELQAAGRPVTLAVGRHTRLPRTYRGRDIHRWLDAMGVLSEGVDDLPSSERRPTSLQLVGHRERGALDLPTLAAAGVRLVGRVTGAEGHRVARASDLAASTARADAKMARTLASIDAYVDATGIEAPPAEAPPSTVDRASPPALDLRSESIRSVIWATGYRRRYWWLHVPVLDERGEIRQRGGVTEAPGLYTLGIEMMRTRGSHSLDGVGADASAIVAHLSAQLRCGHRRAA